MRKQYETAHTSSLVRNVGELPPELSFIYDIPTQGIDSVFNYNTESHPEPNLAATRTATAMLQELSSKASENINSSMIENIEDDEEIDYDEETQESMRELLEVTQSK